MSLPRIALALLLFTALGCASRRERYVAVTPAPSSGGTTASEDPSAEHPSGEDPNAPIAEDPGTSDPAAEDPSLNDLGTEDPSAEDPSAEDPSAEDPNPDAPVIVAPEPILARVSAHAVTVDGAPPPRSYTAMIQSAIADPLEQTLDCYAEALARDRATAGDLGLRLWVSSHQVIRATPERPLADEALQTCAIARIRALRLPSNAPRAGATVRFTLRFATGTNTAAAAFAEAQREVR